MHSKITEFTASAAEGELRNIVASTKVSFALDLTDIGRNIVGLEGTARRAQDQPPASEQPGYLAKYSERMAGCSAPERFAVLFSAAVIITPARLHT